MFVIVPDALLRVVVVGCLAMSTASAVSARAPQPLSPATIDRVRALCEASSADLAGKRGQRRCRAGWQERLERLGTQHGRPVQLLLR